MKLQGYYIDIEPALKYGEIVLNYPAPQNHNWLNDTTFLIAYGKVTGNKDAKLLETYMIKVHNELYEKTKEDEFEFKGALNNVTAEYMSAIDHFDTNKIYSIKSDFLFFSSYDFKNNSLPIQWTVTSLQSVVNINGYYDRSIDLVLLNSNSFSNLSISQENANMLIKRRKDEFGSVNRKLYSVINFKVTSKGLQKDYKAIPANITSIDCYEYDNYEYNYLGTIEPK